MHKRAVDAADQVYSHTNDIMRYLCTIFTTILSPSTLAGSTVPLVGHDNNNNNEQDGGDGGDNAAAALIDRIVLFGPSLGVEDDEGSFHGSSSSATPTHANLSTLVVVLRRFIQQAHQTISKLGQDQHSVDELNNLSPDELNNLTAARDLPATVDITHKRRVVYHLLHQGIERYLKDIQLCFYIIEHTLQLLYHHVVIYLAGPSAPSASAFSSSSLLSSSASAQSQQALQLLSLEQKAQFKKECDMVLRQLLDHLVRLQELAAQVCQANTDSYASTFSVFFNSEFVTTLVSKLKLFLKHNISPM
jgi:hypothetical protein